MADFKSLLSKPLDAVEKPRALPAGTFLATVTKYELKESQEKKTPYIEFTFAINGPGDDIDPSDMEGIDLSKKTLRTRYFLTPDSEYRLKDFITSMGIPSGGRTFGETLPETMGQPVQLFVKQRQSSDGTEIFNEVDRSSGTQGG